jgi:class 3 adenylate cyclase
MGIHTQEVVLGAVGSHQGHLEWVAIGDGTVIAQEVQVIVCWCVWMDV